MDPVKHIFKKPMPTGKLAVKIFVERDWYRVRHTRVHQRTIPRWSIHIKLGGPGLQVTHDLLPQWRRVVWRRRHITIVWWMEVVLWWSIKLYWSWRMCSLSFRNILVLSNLRKDYVLLYQQHGGIWSLYSWTHDDHRHEHQRTHGDRNSDFFFIKCKENGPLRM